MSMNKKEAYLFNLGEKMKLKNKVYNLVDKLLIIFLFIYIVVAVVTFPDQQIMSKEFKENSDMHFTVQFEQATGIPLYYINKEAVETFDELIKEEYPDASKYEIKLIGNTIESKGINWQDVTGNKMEVYGEIVGVENKDPKYTFGAEVTAGLREDYYSTHYNSSKEEYDKYKNGKIMVFNVSYIDARASTVLSLIIFILIPVFAVVLIYLVLKFLIKK